MIQEPFWLIWSNGDETRVFIDYPDEIKDKPSEIAKYLEKWFNYPTKVTYRGLKRFRWKMPSLRSFYVEVIK